MSAYIPVGGLKLVIISDEDVLEVSKYPWSLTPAGYAQTIMKINGKNKHVYLHRMIMGAKTGEEVDHKNGDLLDCRRESLRLCTPSQNRANRRSSSKNKYRGVYTRRGCHGWGARIKCKGKIKSIGWFKDEESAARAYDRAAIELFGEFSRLNFPVGL